MRINKYLVLGISFFLLFISSFIVIQMDLLGGIRSTQVVLAKDDIPRDKVLTNDDIFLGNIPSELVTDGMVRNPKEVIGKLVTDEIGKNMFIVHSKLEEAVIKPTEEHKIFLIPSGWIAEIQGTIRRYDLINIHAIVDISKKEEILISQKNEAILKSVPIAYIKDRKNSEVQDVEESERLKGSARPAQIELSLTDEQFAQLEKLYIEGYKFVFSR